MAAATTIDFQSREFIIDPYPTYRQLREAEHPYWLPHTDRTGSEGIWLFTRYADVAALLRDTQFISKDVSRLVPTDRLSAVDRMLLNLDPPEHTRLRAVVAPLFSVRRVVQLGEEIEAIVDELLEAIEPGKETDFMAAFAVPLPLRVVAGILGVPLGDMPRLKVWTDRMIAGLDSAYAPGERREQAIVALGELTAYLSGLIARDSQPRDSLLHHVAMVQREVGTPTPDEVLSLCVLMVLAGHETTVNLLGTGLLSLMRHPEQLERLRREPRLASTAVEEMLRFESPLQRGTFRVTTAPYRIAAVELEPGQQVSAVIGAANRDPAEFTAPDDFDVTRRPNRHLAFGKGVHKCLGERLARAEARIAFSRLLERFPAVRLLDEQPRWQDKTLFRGLKTLRVEFAR